MPIRFEKSLLATLEAGSKRTPHKKQELIRITLRRYLPTVIEEESVQIATRRVTNVEPWPKGVIAKAYKNVENENWDKVEEQIRQAPPRMDD